MIILNYKLSESEIYSSLVAVFKSRFITNILRIIGFAILAIMIFLIASSWKNGTLELTGGLVIPIFLSIYLIFLSEITAKFQAMVISKKRNSFSEPLRVKIYETGYQVAGDTFNNQQAWKKLNAIIETKAFFLFKENDRIATVIPKRVLESGEFEELTKFIHAVTGPKIKLLVP